MGSSSPPSRSKPITISGIGSSGSTVCLTLQVFYILLFLLSIMTKLRKLNRATGHRMSMLRTMVSQLVKHERIETTITKAKEVRRCADKMVSLGKEGTLSAARHAAAFVRGDDVLHKLFTELAYRYKDRAGGYTRVLRTRIRVGDAAPMAYIEFIDRENELRQSKPPAPQPAQRPPLDPWTKSQLSRSYASPKEVKSSEAED
ncbi:hypothetical protein SSX86_000332 [Deinandra increscens subsp. villosa]|uniref:Ribosomal protein L17 n=1 Tax=Deinandra increscens subsp. villosa TaxID=3103831 RepID=A0AAP0E0I6_9ASTR